MLGHRLDLAGAGLVGTGAAGPCGSVARKASGGAGMRGIVRRLTGTAFIRAEGSSSRWASSAPETRLRAQPSLTAKKLRKLEEKKQPAGTKAVPQQPVRYDDPVRMWAHLATARTSGFAPSSTARSRSFA